MIGKETGQTYICKMSLVNGCAQIYLLIFSSSICIYINSPSTCISILIFISFFMLYNILWYRHKIKNTLPFLHVNNRFDFAVFYFYTILLWSIAAAFLYAYLYVFMHVNNFLIFFFYNWIPLFPTDQSLQSCFAALS